MHTCVYLSLCVKYIYITFLYIYFFRFIYLLKREGAGQRVCVWHINNVRRSNQVPFYRSGSHLSCHMSTTLLLFLTFITAISTPTDKLKEQHLCTPHLDPVIVTVLINFLLSLPSSYWNYLKVEDVMSFYL